MKKIHLFLFFLLLSIKKKNCFKKDIKNNILKNGMNSNILKNGMNSNILKKDGKEENVLKNDNIAGQTSKNEQNEGQKKQLRNKDVEKKGNTNNSIYSFASLKFIPFIVQSFIHTGAKLTQGQIEEKHIYNFEKSPTVRYLLIAEERKNNFLYIVFLVISFAVVLLISFFIFKFFFNL
ncbi:apical rhoptry neck protein, putative [Plasmodium malariae]|uniref:Apical rhoptry neck protein, putative n=1 Tax=Plasmodium malariae TaxID=5858 RepID=A0A1D3RIE3_PLAMA|nr:apical rhoptry neck protein, putative [Plasmodium malariae]SCN44962.1 apical rhoptry neck protein, putative [Plasmodium malariae]